MQTPMCWEGVLPGRELVGPISLPDDSAHGPLPSWKMAGKKKHGVIKDAA